MPELDLKYTERRCKVCMSKLRDAIDLMLLGEVHREDGRQYRYQDIVAWAAERDLAITEGGLSRHFSSHVQPGVKGMLETQQALEALEQATGKKLSLHKVFAGVVASKVMRELDERTIADLPLDRLIRLGLMAGRNGLHIEKAERMLTETTIKTVEEKMTKAGASPEAVRMVREELYGLAGEA